MTAPLKVLFADDTLLVLDKPAGLLSVPGRGADKQDCLSARAQAEYPDALIVHRLDMATSGLLLMALLSFGGARAQDVPYTVVGDAIPAPLIATPGDAPRGRAIVADRRVGLCLLCHSGPFPEERFQGNLAPSLAGAGSRYTAGQLRLRLADARRLNAGSLMPAYYRATSDAERDSRVGAAWQGKTLLSAQQVEDVLAFLMTLKD